MKAAGVLGFDCSSVLWSNQTKAAFFDRAHRWHVWHQNVSRMEKELIVSKTYGGALFMIGGRSLPLVLGLL